MSNAISEGFAPFQKDTVLAAAERLRRVIEAQRADLFEECVQRNMEPYTEGSLWWKKTVRPTRKAAVEYSEKYGYYDGFWNSKPWKDHRSASHLTARVLSQLALSTHGDEVYLPARHAWIIMFYLEDRANGLCQ